MDRARWGIARLGNLGIGCFESWGAWDGLAGVGLEVGLAGANASRAEKPAGKARICWAVSGVVGGCVSLVAGVALRGTPRVLWGVYVGEVLGEGTWRACGSAHCEFVDGERGPSMTVSQFLLSLLSDREWTDCDESIGLRLRLGVGGSTSGGRGGWVGVVGV